MKKFNPANRLKPVFIAAFICLYSFAHSQVITQDSLALVDLYNSTDGANWGVSTNWLSGNVANWYGVTTNGNRVSKVNLSGNNLTGNVAASINDLDSLTYLNLSFNGLTGLPAFSNPVLDTLLVGNNKLTFKSLQPNTNISAFTYVPQDSVDAEVNIIVPEQNTLAMRTDIDTGAMVDNIYQWFKDGDSIPGANTRAYTILCMDSAAVGTYTVRIQNILATELTIWRRPYHVGVQKLAIAGIDIQVCDSTAALSATAPVTGVGVWSILSGSGTIVNANSNNTTVTNLSAGANIFRWTVNTAALCPSSNDYVTITRDVNPSLAFAGPDASVCNEQYILTGNVPAVGTGNWTVISGTGIVAQPTSAVTAINNLSNGENILRWQITNGVCPASFFDEIKIYRDDTLATVNAGADFSLCPTNATLSAVLPENAHGIWTLITGAGTLDDSSIIAPSVTGLAEGANVFRWTVNNSCNLPVSDDVIVNVYNFIYANAGDDKDIYYSPIVATNLAEGVFVGTGGNGSYTYNWSPANNLDNATLEHPAFLTPDIGTYAFDVTVTDGNGCTATDAVVYNVVKATTLDIPKLITPNGDGVNDVLYIPGVESYPDNELSIYDRNGQLVYRQQTYQNTWDGISSEGALRNNTQLKADTYFYVLKLNDDLLQKGFFEIKR
jgi:gliding motility-associated-like protein